MVPVNIRDAASGFKHRGELVYLPPAWFATNPPPQLPTVMMIGGEFNTPADWLRAGNAVKTIDDFAAAHGGNAPVFVFVDSGGAFNNDTECVNGTPRQRRRPSHQRCCAVHGLELPASVAEPRQLGHRRLVDGRHLRRRPGRDASGHVQRVRGHRRRHRRPTRATRRRPSQRLFGGNAAAYAAFDPTTVITRHGPYAGVAGWFDINGTRRRSARVVNAAANPNDQTAAANSLCATGSANGINCAVVSSRASTTGRSPRTRSPLALPWLAGQIGTPGVPVDPAAWPRRRRCRRLRHRPRRRTQSRICRRRRSEA